MVKAKRKSPRHSARQSQARSRPRAKAKPKAVTVAALKRAVEGRNAEALAGMYADDAVLLVIDRDNPPSNPRRLAGKAEIARYFGDVCGRDMTHMIENGVASGNQLAFTQSCTYPDGTKVFCSAMLDLKRGKIRQQTVVQAWDG
jgi:ketosteroid isomerase-like protein